MSQTDAMAEAVRLTKESLPQGAGYQAPGIQRCLPGVDGRVHSRFGLGILVAYMVLASQFNSFIHPVTVLTILLLSVGKAASPSGSATRARHLPDDRAPPPHGHREEELDHPRRLRGVQAMEQGKTALEAMRIAGRTPGRSWMTTVSTLVAAILAGAGTRSWRRSAGRWRPGGRRAHRVDALLLVVPCFYVLVDRLHPHASRTTEIASDGPPPMPLGAGRSLGSSSALP
ncbi:MAG: hypothetical protein U0166_13660 [Acidobacteriota bacterium]